MTASRPERLEARAASPDRPARLTAAVNGQVLSTATVAALSTSGAIGAVGLMVGLAVTMVVFWITHAYAEALSMSVSQAGRLPLAEVRRIMAQEWPIASAAAAPLIALGLAALGAWSTETGVVLSLTAGILGLGGWGLLYAHRAHLSWWRAIVAALLNAAILGLVIVALKVLVH